MFQDLLTQAILATDGKDASFVIFLNEDSLLHSDIANTSFVGFNEGGSMSDITSLEELDGRNVFRIDG